MTWLLCGAPGLSPVLTITEKSPDRLLKLPALRPHCQASHVSVGVPRMFALAGSPCDFFPLISVCSALCSSLLFVVVISQTFAEAGYNEPSCTVSPSFTASTVGHFFCHLFVDKSRECARFLTSSHYNLTCLSLSFEFCLNWSFGLGACSESR